jgi:hypothetical protein
MPERIVSVAVPFKVSFQLEGMQRITASVLERLGCPKCHSGWDIRFDISRTFVVDEKLNIREMVGGAVIVHG